MLKKIFKNKNGFSLLEMLVAVTVFSIAAVAATDIFQMTVEGQRNAIAAQNTQESMRYALEVMSKELRMAQKVESAECLVFNMSGKVYKINEEQDELYFKNKDGQCVKYGLNGNRLEITRDTAAGFITPNEIKISNLKFFISDIGSGEDHSKATMSIDVEAVGKELHKQPFKIQMTVSSRYYE